MELARREMGHRAWNRQLSPATLRRVQTSGNKSALSLALIALAFFATAACTEPLEFPDWSIPVAEGTRVIEYAGVPLDERDGEPIRLVRDLEIGRDAVAAEYAFYRAWSVAVDDTGQMYVVNAGSSEVLVFDPDGRFVRRLGQEGQGPGEFGDIYEATFAAGRLTVEDGGNGRLSAWAPDGTHLGEVPTFARTFGVSRGLADGSYVGEYSEFFRDETPSRRERWVAHASAAGELIRRIVELPDLSQEGGIEVPHPYETFAVALDGTVYMTPTAEYEVFAFTLDGQMRWALRATWARTPITQEIIDGVQPYVDSFPPGRGPDPVWPDTMPALRHVWVDGHGHLYVVPYFYFNETLSVSTISDNPMWADLGPMPPAAELLPVDVYSRDGELLFAGMIESAGQHSVGWNDALGDHVYRMSRDWDTGELFLERLRLLEPF